MKKWLSIGILLATVAASVSEIVTLAWQHGASGPDPATTYRIYHSTDVALPVAQWAEVAQIAGDQTNHSLNIMPGEHFFVMNASNFWGLSSNYSNVASTPEVPVNPITVIIRLGP
jgi:alpha/beta superfamily hydrolase